jgi:photosystem II stability/assembly factor-like uncharacterized protein
MTDRDDELTTALRDYYQRMAQEPSPDVSHWVATAAGRRARRVRRWGAIGGGVFAAAAVGAVVAVALVTHNQPTSVAPGHRSTPSPAASPSATPTSAPPTSGAIVAGPPVLGFVPIDVTAISASQWWVLGYNGPSCASASCTRIVHTTDGGQTFSSLPVPPVPPAQHGQQPLRLRFADASDGWVVSAGGDVWATHDAGQRWTDDGNSHPVTDLEASDGLVYAIACQGTSCWIQRSPTGHDSWMVLPASEGSSQLSHLNVNGVHVWAAIGAAGSGVRAGSLLASTDGGQSFNSFAVCSSDLGFADVYAVDSSVLWVTCPTGTQAAVYRSVDGGQHFTSLDNPGIPNNASIAGVSSTTAVIGSAQDLLRTTDGGRNFATVEGNQQQWTVVGFTTQQNGFAIALANSGLGQSLWRTDDAGAHWHQVTFP